jgi:hypothetical protein
MTGANAGNNEPRYEVLWPLSRKAVRLPQKWRQLRQRTEG